MEKKLVRLALGLGRSRFEPRLEWAERLRRIEGGISCILVPSEPRPLAEAILKLAEAPEARCALGRGARERVRGRFSLERLVEGYESLYVRAVEKRRPPHRPSPAAPEFTGMAGAPALEDVCRWIRT